MGLIWTSCFGAVEATAVLEKSFKTDKNTVKRV